MRIPTTLALVGLCLGACISTNPPQEFRYFRPAPQPTGAPTEGAQAPIRLARPSAAAHLRERMVWRLSDVEFTYDEVNRWVAPPAELVEDAITRALPSVGLCRSNVTEPILEVHVEAFERDATQVIVSLAVTLHTADQPPGSHAVRAVRRIDGDGPQAFAEAAGPALAEAARAVAAIGRR